MSADKRKKRRKLLLLIPALALSSAAAFNFLPVGQDSEPHSIRISGNIEATDAAASFRISGRIEERFVSEGETIQRGQSVASLEQSELLQEVALRQAEVRAARAALAELEAGSRPEEIAQTEAAVRRAEANLEALKSGSRRQEIAAAQAVVERARAEANRLKAELGRQEYLYENGIVSDREFDAARTAFAAAEATLQETLEQAKLVVEGPRIEEIDAAQAALEEIKERHALVKKGPRAESIEQAKARLEQAEESLKLSRTRLAYSSLYSPISGIVLSEHIEAGEYVNAGTPIVTVGYLETVWLRGYVMGSDLGRVKPGQRVRVTTDTYPDKVYEGRLTFIASEAEFTPKNVQTQEQRVKLVYRVKIDIANPALELKPGMPADAEILVGEAQE